MSTWRMRAGELAFRVAPRLLPLSRIGAYHGTAKVRVEHLGRNYLQIYEHYLSKWRGDAFAILEIGVYRGESLQMWQTYFKRARVNGLDIDPNAAARVGGAFPVYTGSQADQELLERALTEIGSGLRLVIDDGSHINELTVATFDYIFPRLSSGAIYIIEDLAPGSYEHAWDSWPGMTHNVGVSFENRREDIDRMVLELGHDADDKGSGRWGAGRTVGYVHLWPGILIVERA
jgi:hypothetical protein